MVRIMAIPSRISGELAEMCPLHQERTTLETAHTRNFNQHLELNIYTLDLEKNRIISQSVPYVRDINITCNECPIYNITKLAQEAIKYHLKNKSRN